MASSALAVAQPLLTKTGLEFSIVSRSYESFLFGIIVWDWLVNLKSEWHLVWKARLSLTKLLYLVSRYACLLLTLALFILHFINHPFSQCDVLIRLNCLALMIIQSTSVAVLTQRAYLVSRRNKLILVPLLSSIITIIVIGTIHAVKGVRAVDVTTLEGSSYYCRLSIQSGYDALTAVFLGLPILAHTFATIVVVIYARKDLPKGTYLQQFLMVDGLLYLIAVDTVGILQFLFFVLSAYPGLRMLNAAALLAMTSVFCCRLILHLRIHADQISSGLPSFASPPDWTNSFGKPISSEVNNQSKARISKDGLVQICTPSPVVGQFDPESINFITVHREVQTAIDSAPFGTDSLEDLPKRKSFADL